MVRDYPFPHEIGCWIILIELLVSPKWVPAAHQYSKACNYWIVLHPPLEKLATDKHGKYLGRRHHTNASVLKGLNLHFHEMRISSFVSICLKWIWYRFHFSRYAQVRWTIAPWHIIYYKIRNVKWSFSFVYWIRALPLKSLRLKLTSWLCGLLAIWVWLNFLNSL